MVGAGARATGLVGGSTIIKGLFWALPRFDVSASSLLPRAKCQNQPLLHDKPTVTQQMSALTPILVITKYYAEKSHILYKDSRHVLASVCRRLVRVEEFELEMKEKRWNQLG